jgi:hypothetical protein
MSAFYSKLTFEEVRAADKDRVVILPVGATEDHGPHMALDTDTLLVGSVAEGAAAEAPDEILVMPTIPYQAVEEVTFARRRSRNPRPYGCRFSRRGGRRCRGTPIRGRRRGRRYRNLQS